MLMPLLCLQMLVAYSLPPADNRHHAIKSDEAQLLQQRCWIVLISLHKGRSERSIGLSHEKSVLAEDKYARSAYDALSYIKDRRSIPVLQEGLRANDAWSRMAAAYALARLGEPSGIAALRDFLNDRDENIKLSAARDLCRVHDPKGTEALERIALADFSEQASPRARRIADRLTFKGVVDKSEDCKSAVELHNMLMHKTMAAGYLFHEGVKKDACRRTLLDMLGNPNWQIRNIAFDFLARGGDLSGVEIIKKDLNDADAYYRFQTAETLLQFGDRSGMDVIKKALNGKKENVRLAAACCLMCIGDRSGWELVQPQFKSDKQWLLWKFAVAKCGCIIPRIEELLASSSTEDIAGGLKLAIDLDDPAMVERIAPLLDKNAVKDYAAVSILYLLRKREKDVWSPRFLF